MQELNLDVASEFLVMAATLIHIKSRCCCRARRRPPADPDDDDRPARRCWCSGCSTTRVSKRPPNCCTSARRCATRSGRGPTRASRKSPASRVEPELEVDLFSLLAAFRRVLERAKERAARRAAARTDVDRDAHRAAARRSCPKPKRAVSRSSSTTSPGAADLIVTFLALLEMIRLKLVRVFQPGGSGAIRIYQAGASHRCAASHPRSRRRVQVPSAPYRRRAAAVSRRATAGGRAGRAG